MHIFSLGRLKWADFDRDRMDRMDTFFFANNIVFQQLEHRQSMEWILLARKYELETRGLADQITGASRQFSLQPSIGIIVEVSPTNKGF